MQKNSPSFECAVRNSITGLHVKLSGVLHSRDVEKFSSLVKSSLGKEQRLFLDVRSFQVENDAVRSAFKASIAHIEPKKVIFKGEQGVSLGNQGNRVLFMKDSPCKCAGACKSCACDSRVKDRNAKFVFKKGQALAV